MNFNKKLQLIKKIFIQKKSKNKKFTYPLLTDGYSSSDLQEAAKVLLSGRLTMSNITKKFEKYFAKKIGSKYALMVNSGSSANLLALFCLINPYKKNRLKKGDECIVPSLCWSTSLWPIIQAGLSPVFADVNLETFTLDLKNIKKNITKKTKAIMILNVLGNCSELDKIKKFCNKRNIYLIEDSCEALGSKYKNKYLGTFGNFGTFSFYYSHQITSGEGGMIVCDSKQDFNILKSLRAHGWDREINKQNVKDFNFINEGFNLRPLDLTASIGLNQFKRLNKLKSTRAKNRDNLIKSLKLSKKWNNQFSFFNPQKNLDPSWFGFPLMINKNKIKSKKNFLNFLNKNRIETRPIISGNFINQPAIKKYKIKYKRGDLINSQDIEDRGFFIGLPTEILDRSKINKITNLLLNVNNF